jgi:hypothetical protein
MELDDLKALWAQDNRRLERSVRLNTLLLERSNLRRASTAMGRLSRGLTFELVANFAALLLLGSFAAANVSEPRFVVPAVLLGIYSVTLVAGLVRETVAVKGVDYDEPVVAIQRKLLELRVMRLHATLRVLLFAPLMWLPLCIVLLRGLFGIDLYAAGSPWLVANVLFGLAVIPAGIFAAKRYGQDLGTSAPLRGLADAVAGKSLTEALDALEALRRFGEGGSTPEEGLR